MRAMILVAITTSFLTSYASGAQFDEKSQLFICKFSAQASVVGVCNNRYTTGNCKDEAESGHNSCDKQAYEDFASICVPLKSDDFAHCQDEILKKLQVCKNSVAKKAAACVHDAAAATNYKKCISAAGVALEGSIAECARK